MNNDNAYNDEFAPVSYVSALVLLGSRINNTAGRGDQETNPSRMRAIVRSARTKRFNFIRTIWGELKNARRVLSMGHSIGVFRAAAFGAAASGTALPLLSPLTCSTVSVIETANHNDYMETVDEETFG